MKCQNQFSWNNKKTIINLLSAVFTHRVVKVNCLLLTTIMNSIIEIGKVKLHWNNGTMRKDQYLLVRPEMPSSDFAGTQDELVNINESGE